MIQKKVIFLMGPTGIGKTNLAINLKNYFPIEIINVDSTLIYRGMNIGTAKPSLEERLLVPHHLLDIIDPCETYSVVQFRRDALIHIKNIILKNKIPILVGGTMLYYKSLLYGLSPLPPANSKIRKYIDQILLKHDNIFLHQQLSKVDLESSKIIHHNDIRRISRALEIFLITGKTLTEIKKIPGKKLPYKIYQFALITKNKNFLYSKINYRLKKMLLLGFEEEVRKLFIRKDLNLSLPSINSIGYRQMWKYLLGKINYEEMIKDIILATKKLIKKQMTWLRNWENIYFIDETYTVNQICNFIYKKINFKK